MQEIDGCHWCADEHLCRNGRRQKLCSTCFRIAANQRRLSKLIGEGPLAPSALSPASENFQYRYQLAFYQERELQRRAMGQSLRTLMEDPAGLGVEYLFSKVAELAGCPRKVRLFHGTANTFTHEFTAAQRKLLISMLMDIVRRGGRGPQVRLAATQAAQASIR